MFRKGFLPQIRAKLTCKGIWYRVLDDVERGILSISAKIIDAVLSDLLNSHSVKIIAKLMDAFKSGLIRYFERFGMESVKVSKGQAYFFGYRGAKELSKT